MKPFLKRFAAATAVWLVIPGMTLASTVTVHRGDSLWSIANQHHTTVSELVSMNHLHSTTLHPNQTLQVPGGRSGATSKTKASVSTKSSTKRVATVSSTRYVTVSRGETVWSLAKKYGVSTSSIMSANRLSSRSVLHIGERLIIPSSSAVHALSGRSEGTNSTLADATLGAAIASYAEQFQGVPYRWGGTTPSGFDCSGFVLYVYGHFGIWLGRTSYSQASEGVAADKSNPDIGDIVYFNTDGAGASHVGIYLGNGEFINAEDRGVRIDSLRSGYWAYHYIGARHVR